MIDKVVRSGVDITNGYENWFEIGRALVNEYGESGRNYYHQLSSLNPCYNYDKCDRQYDACVKSPGNASKGTIFHFAKIHGIAMK